MAYTCTWAPRGTSKGIVKMQPIQSPCLVMDMHNAHSNFSRRISLFAVFDRGDIVHLNALGGLEVH
jgi:hypothetical protein